MKSNVSQCSHTYTKCFSLRQVLISEVTNFGSRSSIHNSFNKWSAINPVSLKRFQVTWAKMADIEIFYICHFHFTTVRQKKKKKNVNNIHTIFLPTIECQPKLLMWNFPMSDKQILCLTKLTCRRLFGRTVNHIKTCKFSTLLETLDTDISGLFY